MTDSETEAPERVYIGWDPKLREWVHSARPLPSAYTTKRHEFVRADRLAAMEPEPNARALYVRTDIDTAEEIARLRKALTEIDALDPEHLIDSCAQTAMRGLVLRMGEIARAALTDTASAPVVVTRALDGTLDFPAADATEAARQTPTDEGQACDAGDVGPPCTCHSDDNPPRPCPRRYALTECREAAKALEETSARIIYEAMRFDRSVPEWVPHGNSNAQDEARRVARRVLSLVPEYVSDDAGDVRRRALEEARNAAWRAWTATTNPGDTGSNVIDALDDLIATPPQPAPTVQEAAEWVEPMYTLAMLGLLTDEYQRSPDFRDAVDDALALSQRRFLSQQEGGE